MPEPEQQEEPVLKMQGADGTSVWNPKRTPGGKGPRWHKARVICAKIGDEAVGNFFKKYAKPHCREDDNLLVFDEEWLRGV